MAIIEIDVQDFLPLGESETQNPSVYSIVDSLGLSDYARNQFLVESIAQSFYLVQTVTVDHSIHVLSVTDSFIMYDKGAKTYYADVIDIFFMWEEGRPIEYEAVVDSLVFVQSVTVISAKSAVSTFTMADSATMNISRTISVEQTLVLVSRSASYVFEKYRYSTTPPSLSGPNTPEC